MKNGVIYTPPMASSALFGITRDSLMELARDLGYPIEERVLPREFVYTADEAFFSGTAAEVTPIRSVDKIQIGEGKRAPITATEAGMIIVTGEPIGAVMAAIVATYVGKRVTGKTPLDMMDVPIVSILIGGLAGVFFYSVTGPALVSVSGLITRSVENSPIFGSSVISLLWAVLLMLPASSAALSLALQLDDTASAAALVGCTVQFVGFTVMSLRENDIGGFLAQLICTPKVQLPNVTKNLKVPIPPFISAVIVASIATALLGFKATAAIGGLGLCSLIAPLYIIENNGMTDFAAFLLFWLNEKVSSVL